MHRITKLKATQAEPAEPGKASPVKAAKRAADGKAKGVIADPDDEEGGANEDAEATEVCPPSQQNYPRRTPTQHIHRSRPPCQRPKSLAPSSRKLKEPKGRLRNLLKSPNKKPAMRKT